MDGGEFTLQVGASHLTPRVIFSPDLSGSTSELDLNISELLQNSRFSKL